MSGIYACRYGTISAESVLPEAPRFDEHGSGKLPLAISAWGKEQRTMGRRIQRAAGFTLIELMVVIIILGLLAAIVMPRIVGETDKARYGAAQAQMRILEDAMKRYKLDNGVYPTTEQGLEALVQKPSSGVVPRNWPEGGYLDKQEMPLDPWGNRYVYISPGQHSPDFDIKSFGADGLEGGEEYNADIESWRVQQ
jgi:general secretion pathway protein G